MKSTKQTSHAFIVRIWIESREKKGAEPIWRGVIEPVEGDQNVYFDQLDKLIQYFANFLQKIGIAINQLDK